MWKLVSAAEGGEKYPLLVDTENVIGRKDCSVVLKNDPSISRKHAIITIKHPENHVSHSHMLPTVKVKDASKYGTFVNQKKITEECTLKSGDRIKFGSDKSKFSIIYEPFIVTTSCLDPAMKKTVKRIMRELGGHVTQEWQKDCSMVVMSNLSVTIKVMCALISCANVVTPEYFTKLLETTKQKEQKPDPTDFLPPLAESQINASEVSFDADPSRQMLFQGKMFIFLTSKQFKKLNLAIELGGGVPILMEEGTDDNDDSVLVAPGTCVMECSPSEQSQQLSQNAQEWISHVLDYLKKNNKRAIPEAELGFAALYSSTDKYCNPDGDMSSTNLGAIPGPTLSQQIDPNFSQSMAYAADTEPSQFESKHTARSNLSKPTASVVPELNRIKEEPISQCSIVDNLHEIEAPIANTRKRARDEEEDGEPLRKQVKVEQRSKSKSPSPGPIETKRKARDASPGRNDHDINDNENKRNVDNSLPKTDQGKSKQKNSPDPLNDEIEGGTSIFDFDSVPLRAGRARKASKKSSASDVGYSVVVKASPRTSPRKRSPGPETVNEMDGGTPSGGGRRKSPRKRSPTPEPVNEFDGIPVRTRPGGNSRKKSPSPLHADEGSEFDQIPTRTCDKRAGTKQSRNTTASDLFQGNKSNDIALASDSDDGAAKEFDSVPPRKGTKRKGRGGSRSPSPGKAKNDNEFDQVPPRQGKSTKLSAAENLDRVDGSGKKSVKKEHQMLQTDDTDFDDLKNVALDQNSELVPESENFDDAFSKKTSAKMKRELERSPVSPVRESKTNRDIKPPRQSRVSPQRTNVDTAPEDGFLTTTRPIGDQRYIKNEDNLYDPDVPAACAKVNYTSLVVRRQKPTKDGSTMPQVWKGMSVKNFKKFKKVQHQGVDELPRVIGGRDLVPHANLAKKQMMEKFAADLQLTQHEEEEDDCRDLFSALSKPERRKQVKKR